MICSEIEIEDVNEDDEYSEVSTDSEDEDDAVVEPGTIMEVENTVVSTPVSIVSATTDSDFDSDVGGMYPELEGAHICNASR